jgi:16S rRNA (guanine527-N7)-methyltransferase
LKRSRSPTPLSPDEFAELIPVSRETLERLNVYRRLLEKWNSSINLVGKGSLGDVWRRHILDSAQLFRYLPQRTSPVILDMGSGAGFPGLVLAIMGVGAVHLVEADQRKAVFLREVARATASDVEIHNKRLEKLTIFPVSVITARALAPVGRLLDLSFPFFSKAVDKGAEDTQTPVALFLKGPTVEAELTLARKRWNMELESIPSLSDPRGVVLRITTPTLRTISRDPT